MRQQGQSHLHCRVQRQCIEWGSIYYVISHHVIDNGGRQLLLPASGKYHFVLLSALQRSGRASYS
eukprot:scaffold33459_cov37-Prasinocladus_malaysianus.AAC.1